MCPEHITEAESCPKSIPRPLNCRNSDRGIFGPIQTGLQRSEKDIAVTVCYYHCQYYQQNPYRDACRIKSQVEIETIDNDRCQHHLG